MQDNQLTIARMKEIAENYDKTKLAMRSEENTAENRTLMKRFENEWLQELMTLAKRL